MTLPTYSPSVRIGNWQEDICLEEDLLKDFLEKKEKGELLIHQTHNLRSNILKEVELSAPQDGFLHFGDVVCVYNPFTEVTLSINMSESQLHVSHCVQGPCGVSGSKALNPCTRNAFVISSCDGSKEGDVLRFGQQFHLSTLPGLGGALNLQSDHVTFMKCAKKSRKQEVLLSSNDSFLSHWQLLYFDPRERLESEGYPVPVNQRLMINHCKTNQRLAVLPEFAVRTTFGRDFEIAAHTMLDSHRAEEPVNHWVLIAGVPPGENKTEPLGE